MLSNFVLCHPVLPLPLVPARTRLVVHLSAPLCNTTPTEPTVWCYAVATQVSPNMQSISYETSLHGALHCSFFCPLRQHSQKRHECSSLAYGWCKTAASRAAVGLEDITYLHYCLVRVACTVSLPAVCTPASDQRSSRYYGFALGAVLRVFDTGCIGCTDPCAACPLRGSILRGPCCRQEPAGN